jgi:hypothetical protein
MIAHFGSSMNSQRRAALGIILLATSIGMMNPAVSADGQSATSPATVDIGIEPAAPSRQLPSDFLGLSYETEIMLPDANADHYFAPHRQALLHLFQTLGIKSLRLGGNFADKPGVPVPGHADIDDLFEFARAAKLKVIYTLRLRETDSPDQDADIARYIMSKYAAEMAYFEIGNEPDFYLKTYPAYQAKLIQFADAIRAAAPDVRFCGPSAGKAAEWARDVAQTLGRDGYVQLITQHAYFGGNSRIAEKEPAVYRAKLLSPAFASNYQSFYDSFVPVVLENHCAYRIEETNSCFNGGAPGVSDTFAAALWGLDYMFWWASHQAVGLNFHTGDTVAAADAHVPCRYAVFTTAPDGFFAHPIAYAMLAFKSVGQGALTRLKIESPSKLNLTAYCVRSPSNDFYVAIINKEIASPAGTQPADAAAENPIERDAQVTINLGEACTHAEAMNLVAPGNDLAAKSGIAFGNAGITANGTWEGSWTPLQPPARRGEFRVTVPASSAVVVRLIRE